MSPEPPANTPPRNRAAQASLVISLIFLIQCVVFLAVILIAETPWAIRFVTANPTHPLAAVADAVVELGILAFPPDLIAGAVAILLGIIGLRAARRLPGSLGKTKSIIGIVAGTLVLILPFVNFLSWASGFRQ